MEFLIYLDIYLLLTGYKRTKCKRNARTLTHIGFHVKSILVENNSSMLKIYKVKWKIRIIRRRSQTITANVQLILVAKVLCYQVTNRCYLLPHHGEKLVKYIITEVTMPFLSTNLYTWLVESTELNRHMLSFCPSVSQFIHQQLSSL